MGSTHGPLFDGGAERAAAALCDRIEQEVGREGEEMVRARLAQVLQHPTGRYESHVHARVDGPGVTVDDDGMVYGPWLEGTGSRNRTTRFKGYATFRKVREALNGRALAIAEKVTPEYVRRMG